jgi:hypothetical protein
MDSLESLGLLLLLGLVPNNEGEWGIGRLHIILAYVKYKWMDCIGAYIEKNKYGPHLPR